MINELIIHMGDTKTGSTSIQRVLSHEMWNAPDRSIVYPALSNHNGLAMTLTQKRAFDKRPVRFERLYEKFTTSDAEFGIISAEHFQFVDPRVFDEAVRTFWPDLSERMRLVAYVRPHASKILSAFAERVKLGLSDSLEQFIDTTAERSLFDYAPRFESWREVFGERFTLRPFIREQLHKGDAVQDFFRFVFGDEEFHIAGEAEANSSLSLSQLAVMRDLHEHMRSRMPRGNAPRIREVREAIGRLVAEHLRASSLGQDGGKLRLPSSRLEFIRERYTADAEALDTAFFEGFPMSEALEDIGKNAIDAPPSRVAQDYFPEEFLKGVAVFSQVLADIAVQSPNEVRNAVARAYAQGDQELKQGEPAGRKAKRKQAIGQET